VGKVTASWTLTVDVEEVEDKLFVLSRTVSDANDGSKQRFPQATASIELRIAGAART
jgi:hypothetical protein